MEPLAKQVRHHEECIEEALALLRLAARIADRFRLNGTQHEVVVEALTALSMGYAHKLRDAVTYELLNMRAEVKPDGDHTT